MLMACTWTKIKSHSYGKYILLNNGFCHFRFGSYQTDVAWCQIKNIFDKFIFN